MIELSNVCFHYPNKEDIINNFSLSIDSFDRVSLIGPSGSGKSSIIRLITGLEKPTEGIINIPKNLQYSVVFQENRLLKHETILNNVALFSNETKAKEILTLLGLYDVINAKPSELSGGMNRRVSLARALAHPFDILILDEPFTGLDIISKEKCMNIVMERCKSKAMLLSTHDSSEIDYFQTSKIYATDWCK